MRSKDSWDDLFNQLSDFYANTGRANVIGSDQVSKQLKDWVSEQIRLKKIGKLDDGSIAKLNTLGLDWHAHGKQWDKWQKHFYKLQKHAAQSGGDPNVSQLMKVIGPWLSSQRVLYRQGLLPQSKRVLLESIGVCWNPSKKVDERWWAQYEKLRLFKDRHGHCNVPRRELPDPGIWVSAQRTAYKKGTLRKERIEALNNLGFCWKVRKSTV